MADLEAQYKNREAAKDDAIDAFTAGYSKLNEQNQEDSPRLRGLPRLLQAGKRTKPVMQLVEDQDRLLRQRKAKAERTT